MKCKKIIYASYTAVKLICFLLCFETTASTQIDLKDTIDQQLNKEQLQRNFFINALPGRDEYQFLKRRRRYLEFPEGSSFQLVYDLIVGVVDFTNYLILGVTVALAWELPSKPPSEIFNDIRERLKDGTLGTSRNDTAESIKYIHLTRTTTPVKIPSHLYYNNFQPMFRPPMHSQYYTPRTANGFRNYSRGKQSHALYHQYSTWPRERYKYYSPKLQHPFGKLEQSKEPSLFSAKNVKYPWWNLPQRLRNSFVLRPTIRRFNKNVNLGKTYTKPPSAHYQHFRDAGRSEHRIYPIFGKQYPRANANSSHIRYRRSGVAEEKLTKLDRMHIEHHRSTRHDLYARIETYLDGRGLHGHHCILRALCETGQKSSEDRPGSFVGELMRSIFTMPEPLGRSVEVNQETAYKQLRYDAANALKGDCATRYRYCKDSLWSSQFVL